LAPRRKKLGANKKYLGAKKPFNRQNGLIHWANAVTSGYYSQGYGVNGAKCCILAISRDLI